MLSEPKPKGPWRITFDTNPDQCNLRCIMCEEHSKYNIDKKSINRTMDFRIIEEVIEDAVDYGLKVIIPSTMGEPLLYKNFIDLRNLIKQYNLKLNLTTNGTFPRLGVKKWAELILPIATDVKISINGTTKDVNESVMEGINFEKQINNITEFIQVRDEIRKEGKNFPTITFQTTFMEKNLNEMIDLLRTAIKLNVDRFKGHHLWVTHPELKDQSLKSHKSTIKKWNGIVEKIIKIAENERLKDGNKIYIDNIYPIYSSDKELLVPNNFLCPFLGREAWIAWDGTFNVCCAPDALRKSFGPFGNVKEEKFMDLWNSDKYRQLFENWGIYEVCKICNMRRPLNKIGVRNND